MTRERPQLEVVCRQIRRPQLRRTDRAFLVLLAWLTARWRQAVLLVQPDTILRWHRQRFRLLWRRRSFDRAARPSRRARLAELAVPKELLVTPAVAAEAVSAGLRFEPAGKRVSKGFDEPVTLFTAERG